MGLPTFREMKLKTPAGNVLLREAQKKDLGALNRIINEPDVNKFVLMPAPVSRKSTVKHYLDKRKSKGPWVICLLEGEVVGSVDLRPGFGRKAHVSDFGIAFSKKAHGRGIALAAVLECFAWLKRNGIEKIVSSVLENNARARKFYKKIGFRERCVLEKNIKHGKIYGNEIVIEKFL